MSDTGTAFLISLCVLGGALLGMVLNRVLPPEHIGEKTEKIINISVGVIATLAALVLGLLVASTKAAFDAKSDEIRQSAVRIVLLDRTLRQIGPEAAPARALLHDLTRQRVMQNRGESFASAKRDGTRTDAADAAGAEKLQTNLLNLKAEDDGQKWLRTRALNLSAEIEHARLLLENFESSIQRPFLVVLVTWLTVIFASLGMFAPRNHTAKVAIIVCALSVTTAIFLILEMDQPFDGLMQISNLPIREALEQIEK